jgi:hypothetical protein
MIEAAYHLNKAHDPSTGETWTFAELIDHTNGCEEQIDFLLAEIEARDKRIKELEGLLKIRMSLGIAVPPSQHLTSIYREMLDFIEWNSLYRDDGGPRPLHEDPVVSACRQAADTLAPVVAPLFVEAVDRLNNPDFRPSKASA